MILFKSTLYLLHLFIVFSANVTNFVKVQKTLKQDGGLLELTTVSIATQNACVELLFLNDY